MGKPDGEVAVRQVRVSVDRGRCQDHGVCPMEDP